MAAKTSSGEPSARIEIPSHAATDDHLATPQKEHAVTAKKPRAPVGHGPLVGVAAKKPRARPGQGPPRKSRAFKVRLLSCAALDGRTHARKHFVAVAKGISEDLGGVDLLSTVQKSLVEAFAGFAVHVHMLNAHLLRGDKVDILAHSQAISTMVRVASRLGMRRVARDIMTLRDVMDGEIEEVEETDEA